MTEATTTTETSATEVSTVKDIDERVIEYRALGQRADVDPIKLTVAIVRSRIATKTKSGAVPSNDDIIKFMMLCQACELNPWVGDAYLVGYDGKDGPTYSLITSIQALLKRAESSPDFDGLESGILVRTDSGIDDRAGSYFDDDELCVGGWCRVYRKDCSKPFLVRVKRSVFDTGRSYWAKDPGFMVCKCAEAAALRKAFPSQTGGMMLREEMEQAEHTRQAISMADIDAQVGG